MDLFGVGHHEQAFESGGATEAVIETHEVDPARALAAPRQRSRKLERVGGAEPMHGEETFGPGAHLFDRLDLEAARPQSIENVACFLKAGLGELPLPVQARESARALDGSGPPEDDLRVPLQESFDPRAGGLSYEQRQEG